jgi:multiple sugar transport system permease protein
VRIHLDKAIIYFLLIVVSFIVAFPFIWLLLTSFKTYPEIYAFPVIYIPNTLTLEHYVKVMFQHNFGRYFLNTFLISMGTGLFSILLAVMPAYAFSRFKFPAKRPLFISILFCQMFPQTIFLIPFFLMLKALQLMDTLPGVILTYLPFTTPIAIWFLSNFFREVPRDLEEMALIDGCGPFQAFYRVALPLVLPGLAAVAIYSFLFAWGELMFALSYLPSLPNQTVPIVLSLFVGQYQTRWGPLFAGSVAATIPAVAIFTLLQSYFVRGLTAGAVKG